jgi:hypothetical protein
MLKALLIVSPRQSGAIPVGFRACTIVLAIMTIRSAPAKPSRPEIDRRCRNLLSLACGIQW